MAAVGTFEPEIEIWNLDVLDALHPHAVLGKTDYRDPKAAAARRSAKVLRRAWRQAGRPCRALPRSSSSLGRARGVKGGGVRALLRGPSPTDTRTPSSGSRGTRRIGRMAP